MKIYLDQVLAGEKSPEPLFQDPELVNERYMLARQGIELERVIKMDGHKLLAIPTDKNLTLVRNWLVQQAHPNIELLERYIQEPKAPHIYLDELQLNIKR